MAESAASLTTPYDLTIPDGRQYVASVRAGSPGVDLHADLDQGLQQYAAKARGLARATIQRGSADGVITFSRPLTPEEFRAVEATGVQVRTVEAVSQPDTEGMRWTFIARMDEHALDGIMSAVSEALLDLDGIVSTTVSVPDERVLDALSDLETVYLVDLSIADFKRHNPTVTDVVQNDVF